MNLLCDPGEPGAKEGIYVLPFEREPMSPMAENIRSSVQTPGLSLTSCVASGRLLNFLHFRFLIHKDSKAKLLGTVRVFELLGRLGLLA